jgi:acetylserotonin N-methyltransferase
MNTHAEPAPILDLIEAFRRSKAMFTAVRLGIFDELERGPQTAATLAERLALNAGACTRLLDGCVSLQLLTREEQTYRNTPVSSRFLVSSSPDTLAGYIVYSDESLYPLWSHLEDAIREGSNRWAQTFGSREALFAHFFRDEAATASFLAGMRGMGQIACPFIVRAFDLGRFSHFVDVGGATGHLAIEACAAYPSLRATVLDLPRVESFARSHIAGSSVADRVEFVPADFFTEALPAGDLYALSRILHDWAEPQIEILLRKIFAALPRGGGLLVAEALVNDERTGSVYALMQDLNMLVCTDGRERTPAEYFRLLQSAGFQKVDYRRTGLLVDAVLAVKQ